MAEPAAAGPRAADGASRPWLLIVVLMLVATYAFIDRAMLSLLVEPIKADLHVSDVQIGLLVGLAFAALYSVFGVPAGYYVDRINRTRMIAIASVVWALMTIVCGTAHSVTQLYLGRMGTGLSEAILMPAAFSLIRDVAPARSRGLAFSIYAMSPIIGSSASLAGGAALLRAAKGGAFAAVPFVGGLEPWQQSLTLVGLCGLPLGLLVLTVREPTRAAAPEKEPLLGGLWTAVRHMGGRWTLYVPLFVFAAFGTMMAFAEAAWLPTALSRQWHMPPQDIGVPLGLMRLVGGLTGLVVGGLVLNRFARRGGDSRLLGALAAVMMTLGIAGLILTPDHRLGYAIAFADFLFIGLNYVIGATTLTEVTPVALVGRASAVFLLFQNLPGQAFGPLVVALVAKPGGPSTLPMSLIASQAGLAIVTVVSALVLRRMIARERRRGGAEFDPAADPAVALVATADSST